MKTKTVLFFILISSSASANVAGDLTHIFNPSIGQDDFMSVESSRLLLNDQVRFHLFIDSAQNVLPSGQDASGQAFSTTDSLKSGYLGAAFRYGKDLEFSLQASTLLMQNSQRPASAPQFAATGLTNVKAALKINILERAPIGMAVVTALNFNRVENNPYQEKQKEINPTVELVADTKLGDFLLGINVGYLWRQDTAIELDPYPDYGNQLLFSAAIAYSINARWTATLETYGATTPGDRSPTNEKLFGLKFRQSELLTLDAGIATHTEKSLFSAESRVFVGARWSWDFSTPPPPPTLIKVPESPIEPDANKIYIQENLLATVHFDYGSSTISKSEAKKLRANIEILNENPEGTRLRLIGRADSRGSEEANQIVSEKRAVAVEKFLHENGLRPGISALVVSYGAQKPLATNFTSLGRRLNRQVGIFIVPPGL